MSQSALMKYYSKDVTSLIKFISEVVCSELKYNGTDNRLPMSHSSKILYIIYECRLIDSWIDIFIYYSLFTFYL